ncbi:MAG: GNAT family N-acetyltransferase [Caulobacteraceae bacterium]
MPSIISRDYAGPEDLRVMQALVQATWTGGSQLHIGDLAWQRYPRAPQADWPTRLWFDGDKIVGWVWVWAGADAIDDEDQFFVILRPDYASLYDELIDWAEAANPSPRLSTPAYDLDAPLVAALARRGYRARGQGPYGVHTFRTLDDLPEPVLPEGFRALSMVEIGDVERKVAGHRASWSRFAMYDPEDPPLVSGMKVERYRDLMETWPYRPDLDFGIEAPDGRIVASCTLWFDAANGVGEFEPVGVDPAFRGLGLSRAMCFAAMRALKAAGGRLATVKPRGDLYYPAPRQAYRKMGFVTEGRGRIYQRP